MIRHSEMKPYVATILKQGGMIVVGAVAVGLVMAGLFVWYQYTQLQHAMTLNMAPPELS